MKKKCCHVRMLSPNKSCSKDNLDRVIDVQQYNPSMIHQQLVIYNHWRATRQIHRVVSSCRATQRETKWQAHGRRAKKYGPATIREAQIAVSEVLGGDYALRALSSISWLLERRASNRSATIFIFFFLEITWFCIPLWFRYHVWICCNASPPCVINTKIFSHVWNW